MGLAKTLAVRGVTFAIVVLVVLLMVVTVLGATGLSDKLLEAIVDERLRGARQSLAMTIRDPDELEKALETLRQDLTVAYGLNQPWYFRLPHMLWRVLTLDLGNARTLKSFSGSSRIADIIMERLPNTVLLVTSAIAISAVIGLFVGVKLATRVGSHLDRALSYFSAVSYALPTWWTGILFILLFAFYFRLTPFGGMYSAPPPPDPLGRTMDLLWHATLPVATLVLALVGSWIYVTRTVVLNTAQEDFVTAARAKGVPENLVMRRYIIRVAAPPILTNIIIGLAGSIGGAILTETVFNWPGMGRLYYDAILVLDEAVIIALTFIFTLFYVVGRFILEVLYVILDPRVRY
jgi:peptide/nickel transport system permease protein